MNDRVVGTDLRASDNFPLALYYSAKICPLSCKFSFNEIFIVYLRTVRFCTCTNNFKIVLNPLHLYLSLNHCHHYRFLESVMSQHIICSHLDSLRESEATILSNMFTCTKNLELENNH